MDERSSIEQMWGEELSPLELLVLEATWKRVATFLSMENFIMLVKVGVVIADNRTIERDKRYR